MYIFHLEDCESKSNQIIIFFFVKSNKRKSGHLAYEYRCETSASILVMSKHEIWYNFNIDIQSGRLQSRIKPNYHCFQWNN